MADLSRGKKIAKQTIGMSPSLHGDYFCGFFYGLARSKME